MNKIVLFVWVILSTIAASGQTADTLDQRLADAIAAKFPEWKSRDARNPFYVIRGTQAKPSMIGDFVDEQRHLNVYIAITDNPEDEFRQFFTREVIPPSRSTSGIGQKGYVIESLYSVEIAFTKENLFVRFEYYFPPPPGKKFKSASPYATQHAPKVELEKAFKMAMAIDQVIVGRSTMTPCNNDFYDPTFPRPTSESGKLLAAAANGETAKVKRLIYSGVSTEVSDVEGNTPLHLAIRLGCIETVRALVDANANPNSRNAKRETPLMIAANQRNVEVTQLLIESGGDVKAKDKYGNNAAFHVLDFANYYYLFPPSLSRENVVTLLKVLKNTGLDLNFHNDLGGDTLLTYNMVDSDPAEQWSDLIGLGVDVNGVDGSGQTTLIKAIKITVPDQRRKKMVEFLLAHGAKPDVKDKNGFSVIDYLRQERIQRAKSLEWVQNIDEAIKLLETAQAEQQKKR